MFTLRYRSDAPIQPRPHAPCVPMFRTFEEALMHLEAQPNHDVLEVVKR